MESYKENLINLLLRANALRFGEYTLKSGRISPYFINAGMFCTGSHIAELGEYYADAIKNITGGDFDIIFGPAYKGIPLATTAASSLYRKYGIDKGVSYNRKEAKDHGEGGILVGAPLKDGDKIIIIEDVIAAGTAVRECMPILKSAAKVSVNDMFIMVDRMEVGQNGKKAPQEIFELFGIKVHALVNTTEIVEYLHNREINGKVVIDDAMKAKIDEYMGRYCEI